MAIKNLLIVLSILANPAVSHAFDRDNLNPKGCNFANMLDFYRAELGIGNAPVQIVEKKLSDPKLKGYTQQLDDGSYLIVLEKHLEPSEVRIALAHELVHVKQLKEGRIKGEEFKKDYLERSFEDEAFRLSMPLAARFYTQMDCTEKSQK